MALDIFESFATDENLEIMGAWKDIGSGAKLRVARMDNPVYLSEYSRLYEENKDVLEAALAAPDGSETRKKGDDKALEISTGALARAVLLGWEGLEYQKKPIKYTTANAIKLLQHRDFRLLVVKIATDVANYRIKQDAEQEKN